MSKEDAPNFRYLLKNTCENCCHQNYRLIGETVKSVCIKYDFTIDRAFHKKCDSWGERIDD